MNDILMALRERAHADEAFRQALLKTRESSDPLLALCTFAQENGYSLSLGDIISDGEEFCCNQMKSTNGGNPMHQVKPYNKEASGSIGRFFSCS